MRHLLRRFNADPAFQYRWHLVMTYFWVANMAAVVATYSFAPKVWAKVAILYLVLVSLYANFATDYGAVAGATAARTAATVEDKLDETTAGGITVVAERLDAIDAKLPRGPN